MLFCQGMLASHPIPREFLLLSPDTAPPPHHGTFADTSCTEPCRECYSNCTEVVAVLTGLAADKDSRQSILGDVRWNIDTGTGLCKVLDYQQLLLLVWPWSFLLNIVNMIISMSPLLATSTGFFFKAKSMYYVPKFPIKNDKLGCDPLASYHGTFALSLQQRGL